MKKTLFLVLIISTLILSSVSVSASDFDAKLDIDYSYDSESGYVHIKGSINDILDPKGLALIDYEIEYDSYALELVDKNINIPDIWQPLLENEMVEDMSKDNGTGSFTWSVLNAASNYGITDDDQLFIELTFKPSKATKAIITFECKYIVNDDLEKLNGNNISIEIDLTSPDTPSIDSDADLDNITTENSENTNESGNITSSEESETLDESANNSDPESAAQDEAADESTSNTDTASNNALSISDESDNTDVSSNHTVIIISVAIGVLVIAVIATIVIKNRKAK